MGSNEAFYLQTKLPVNFYIIKGSNTLEGLLPEQL